MTVPLYFEDLSVGQTFGTGTVTVEPETLKAFAAEFDPQPFHLDELAGRRSIYGGMCASGWHTCSIAMRLTVDNFLRESSSLGSPGLENLRWLKPVFPDDRLTLTHVILESRPMRSRPEVGIVRSRWDMVNQHGEQVLQMEGYGMFGRRHPATPEELARIEAERGAG